MNYEQKYNDLIKRLREYRERFGNPLYKEIGEEFPELADSEDERIISNNIDELNLLKEIQNYHKKYLAGLYITFAMYKRIARYFYFFGKKAK